MRFKINVPRARVRNTVRPVIMKLFHLFCLFKVFTSSIPENDQLSKWSGAGGLHLVQYAEGNRKSPLWQYNFMNILGVKNLNFACLGTKWWKKKDFILLVKKFKGGLLATKISSLNIHNQNVQHFIALFLAEVAPITVMRPELSTVYLNLFYELICYWSALLALWWPFLCLST